MKKNIIICIALAVFLIGGLAILARPGATAPEQLAQSTAAVSQGILTSTETEFDFGEISMKNGNVSHEFTLKNTGIEPLKIEKLYTSCMCTVATLKVQDKKFGPFGMPGHGFIPSINAVIAPNMEAIVEVTFDPNAHGPAGVGRIERTITVEHNAGQPLTLDIRTIVTP